MQGRGSQALPCGAQCQDQRPWAQTGAQEVPSELQEALLHHEGSWAQVQVAMGGCGVSIRGGIQESPGCGPGQLTLGGPAGAVGWDQATPGGASNLIRSMVLLQRSMEPLLCPGSHLGGDKRR